MNICVYHQLKNANSSQFYFLSLIKTMIARIIFPNALTVLDQNIEYCLKKKWGGRCCVSTHLCVILAVPLLHNHAGHALDAVGSVVFIVGLSGHVLQVLHVRANQHVAQLHKVTVRRVFNCGRTGVKTGDRFKVPCVTFGVWTLREGGSFLTFDDAPRVQTTSHPLPSGFHHDVAADDGKWNAFLIAGISTRISMLGGSGSGTKRVGRPGLVGSNL